VIDFSVNVNPYGPAPAVLAAARAVDITRYPDSSARALRLALAARHDIDPAEVVVGNGAADLMWTAARALLRPGDTALVVEPAFAELRAAAAAAGANVVAWRAPEAGAFATDTAAVARLAAASGARLLYLATPGSPTGSHLPAAEVAALAARLPGVTLLLDQAFITLSEHHHEARARFPANVVRLHSLTKDHAIPGLRLGYLLAPAALAAHVEAARPAWTTNAVAQAAGLAALDEDAFIASCRERLLAARRALAAGVAALGLPVIPSVTTYFVAAVGDAGRMRARLLRHRLLVRDCTSFGLPGHIRVGARPPSDWPRLLAALRAELA
jgi:histidinol-phosphate/aromatic aminotransferase/cobyric acid decarboxylase-like protein